MATKANSKSGGVGEGEDGGDAPLLDLNEASVKKLIARAKKRGYITYDELLALLWSLEHQSIEVPNPNPSPNPKLNLIISIGK